MTRNSSLQKNARAAMEQAMSYEEWLYHAERLDAFDGGNLWREKDAQIAQLRQAARKTEST